MAIDERDVQVSPDPKGTGAGLVKGLGVTLKHALRRSITQQYPEVKPDLPPRTRGVIALKEANCTVCYKCSRECPDWCIYIDAHKETHDPASGGKARSVKVLDRFAIDFALCMYCGICIEVCPFDALFWSPEFEYSTYEIDLLTHEKERLEDWTYTVLPPPELEVGAEVAGLDVVSVVASAPPGDAPPAASVLPDVATVGEPPAAAAAAPVAATPATPASPATAAVAAPAEAQATPSPAAGGHAEVVPDQETFDRVLAEQLAQGKDRRVAEGLAKRAAIIAARRKAEGA